MPGPDQDRFIFVRGSTAPAVLLQLVWRAACSIRAVLDQFMGDDTCCRASR
ncbi:hypothetical protein M8494_08640 [Serratia ureilytica]